ncbi:MAG: flagellar filament capping protein FliD [Clostridiaceae bacterium]|nr:flagellar filament capping protein FliD [Clostridiaceae bacterium]
MAIINSNFRLTGLASGLDTDQMVRDLMKVERFPLTKLEQQKQLTQWRQEAYRDFTNALRGFKEKFFDITKQTSYLLSDNAYKAFAVKSSGDEYVTARGTSIAEVGTHTIKVVQLATADKAVSDAPVSKPISGTVKDFQLSGKSIILNLDGVTREIDLSDYANMSELIGDGKTDNGLQRLVNDAFGEGKIMVSNVSGQLQLTTGNGATQLTAMYGTKGMEGLNSLGISSGDSNRIVTSSTLIGISDKLAGAFNFNAEGNVEFEINGEKFKFSQNDTMLKVMETVNNSAKANVRIRYDETTDTFSITAKQTGAGDNIRIKDTAGTFFAAIGIDTENPIKAENQGVDAKVIIDGVEIARSTNVFTVNGIEYTLRKEHTVENPQASITVEQNVDAVVDNIKLFVEEYNKLVDKFITTLSEKQDRNYLPLSSEEKEALSEDEIEKWEKAAKSGILRNDPILSKIQSDMRMALLDSVEGIGINLSSIGITSKSYQDKGKLYIDEERLKEAIREKPDEVKNLFIMRSESVPSYTRNLTQAERSERYKQQGLFHRIADIIEDNISTFRDKNDKKGILLEKAGIQGDLSEFRSNLSMSITSYDERISEMLTKLSKKEENYYRQFSQLEKYMNQMNSQMNWLMSQLGNNTY